MSSSISVDDLVRSAGRIKTIQADRPRFIEFDQAKVIEVGKGGITVTPVGKNAVLLCRPEDLESVRANRPTQAEAEENAPGQSALSVEGSIAVTGEVAEEEKPKADLSALRAKKKRTATDKTVADEPAKPKPKPPARRRRR
jgi:hypothetical protein